jgi:hypothetical protein
MKATSCRRGSRQAFNQTPTVSPLSDHGEEADLLPTRGDPLP